MNRFSAEYALYLASPAWRNQRKRALERAGNRCQLCGRVDHLQVHHNSYANFGHERDEDLVVLCKGCHHVITWFQRITKLMNGIKNPYAGFIISLGGLILDATITVIKGKFIALETGMKAGIYTAEQVRIEAEAIAQTINERLLPEDLRERLKKLRSAGIPPVPTQPFS